MGILNITPDSFYEGSRISAERAAERAGQMIAEGADILDVGGYSTRPGAIDVPLEEEINRVCEAITAIKRAYPQAVISADTFRVEVARKALDCGAVMINDVSGGSPEMYALVAEQKAAYVLMHSRGTPQTMQSLTQYEDLLGEVLYFLAERLAKLRHLGVTDVVIDPGFGFAKTIEQNFNLLQNLSLFKALDAPVLVGLSRKSMIYKTLGVKPAEALNGTTALHAIALAKGADLLRVHDVAPAVQTIRLMERLSAVQG